MNTPLCIGHRGAAGYEPENTLRSFATALRMGADAIELDVHLTADRELVVIHDADLKRTTGCAGKVADLTLREIQQFDAGKGEVISSLREVICFMAGKGRLNIELKGSGTGLAAVREIDRAVASFGVNYDDFILSSFHREELEAVKDSCVPKGIIFEKWPDDVDEVISALSIYSIHLHFSEVTEERLKRLRERGIKVMVWTVNDPQRIVALCRLGVDGIFTDYPDRVSSYLDAGFARDGIEIATFS